MKTQLKPRRIVLAMIFAALLLCLAGAAAALIPTAPVAKSEATTAFTPTAFDVTLIDDKKAYRINGFDTTDQAWEAASAEQRKNIAIVIPATYNELPVRAINESAFQNVPAFGDKYTSVDLSGATNLKTIGNIAFSNVGLAGPLTIPSSVTTIGDSAFSGCLLLDGTLTIPNSVTSIGAGAFRGCEKFTALDLSGATSLETIGNNAFYNCIGFKNTLTIPSSVTKIGNNAFYKCYSFTGALTIPNSVTAIGDGAFDTCTGFTSLTFEANSKLTTIGTSVFSSCRGFQGELEIPNSVTEIGTSAFNGCMEFTSLTFEAGSKLETIGNGAFSSCHGFQGELKIPSSVKTISTNAFYYCIAFNSLTFGANSKLETIGESAFDTCKGLTGTITIPNTVTTLGKKAFYYCETFTTLKFEADSMLTTITSNAFSNCTALSELEIPNSVTEIQGAFSGCTGLKVVTIPSSVTTLDGSVFYNCWNLETVYLQNKATTTYDQNAFYNVKCPIVAADAEHYATISNISTLGGYKLTYETEVTFDANGGTVNSANSVQQTKLYNLSLKYEKNANNIWAINEEYALPTAEKVGSILTGWNDGTGSSTNIDTDTVVVTDAPTYTAQYESLTFTATFDENTPGYTITGFSPTYLDSSEVPNKQDIKIAIPKYYNDGKNGEHPVTAISDNAFNISKYPGYTFTSLTFEEGSQLNTIGNRAFYNRATLNCNLVLPSSLTSIGEEAFSGCMGLNGALKIPNSVTAIGTSAFNGCTGFTSLDLNNAGQLKTIGISAFANCTGLNGKLTIPFAVTKIDTFAFYGCTGFSSLDLTNANFLETIGDQAFEGCTGFTGTLNIPGSVTKIGESAFSGCSSLQTIYFSHYGNITTCGVDAFASVTCPIVAANDAKYTALKTLEGLSGNEYLTYEKPVYFIAADGGTVNGKDNQTKLFNLSFKYEQENNIWAVNGAYTLPTATKDGYTFKGWRTEVAAPVIEADSIVTAEDYFAYFQVFAFDMSLTESAYTITGLSSDFLTSLNETEKLNIEIVIPSRYNNLPVTAIADNAFKASNYTGYKFTSLTFEAGSNLETIGNDVFSSCHGFQGELKIPNSVTAIGDGAFGYCIGFTSLKFEAGSKLTTIHNFAFNGCKGFTDTLTIPKSVTAIDDSAFSYCTGFSSLKFEAGSKLTTIRHYAFIGCTGLKGELKIPNSVTTIGSNAFSDCTGLQTVYLPNNSTTTYYVNAFASVTCPIVAGTAEQYNSLKTSDTFSTNEYLTYETEVTFDANGGNINGATSVVQTKLYGYSFKYEKDATTNIWAATSYTFPTATNTNRIFQGWSTDGNAPVIEADSKVTATTYKACYEILPFTVTYTDSSYTITGFTTTYLNSLSTADKQNIAIVIPAVYNNGKNGEHPVTAIDGLAFSSDKYNGYTFTSLTFEAGSNLVTIGMSAFNGRVSLKNTLTIPKSVTEIGARAFNGCTGFTSLTFEDGSNLKTIGNNAFQNCSGSQGTLTIPKSVTEIGNYAFQNCSGFQGTLTIPKSVTTIGGSAFMGCKGFTALTFENGINLQTISESAFQNCSGFKSTLTIPSSVTTLVDNAFYGCTGFTGLDLSSATKLQTINRNAFYDCSGFKSTLTIPNSVTEIGSNAFSGCRGLSGALTIPKSVTKIGSSAFEGCSRFTSLIFEDGIKLQTIEIRAFMSCSGFKGTLTIPNSVTEIGMSAFSGCTGFTSLTFETDSNLKTIGNGAFMGCTDLVGALTIPFSVKTIDEDAFSGCTGLQTIYLPDNANTIYDVNAFASVTCPIVAKNAEQYNSLKTSEGLSGNEYLTYEATVTFDANGGNINGELTVQQTKLFNLSFKYEKDATTDIWAINEEYALPTATKDGHTFQGWSADGNEPVIEAGSKVTALNYTAKYLLNTLISIEVTSNPTKTAYTAFEDFDAAGMVVTATFTHGTEAITSFSVANSDNLQAGTTTLEISYTLGDVTVTTTVTITVAKLKVTAPSADATVFTYNGSEQTYAVAASEYYTVTGNVRTSAGSQAVTIALKDKANTEWQSGGSTDVTFTFEIAKASYDMSGVAFADVTLKADGSAHKLEVTGLPNGVTATYSGTNGYTQDGVANVGVYVVTATFTVSDAQNYNVPEAMTATLTVNVAEIIGGETDDNGEAEVIISGESGVTPGTEVKIADKPIEDYKDSNIVANNESYTVVQAKDIVLELGGATVQPDGSVTVKLLIKPELRMYTNLRVFRFAPDGTATDMNAVREGNYMVFTTTHFSVYVIAAPQESYAGGIVTHSISGGAIFGIVFAALIVILLLFLLSLFIFRKDKNKGFKEYYVEFGSNCATTVKGWGGKVKGKFNKGKTQVIISPPAEEKTEEVEANAQTSEADNAADETPAEESAEAQSPEDARHTPSAVTPATEESAAEVNSIEVSEDEIEEEAEDETELVLDDEPEELNAEIVAEGKLVRVTYRRTFLAKLIQSGDDVKRYYSAIKNEFKSFGVTSSVAANGNNFSYKRKPLGKTVFGGDTLKLYLAVNPADVERKYNAHDASAVKKHEKTPCFVRVKSDMGLKKALVLIERMMNAEGIKRNPNYVWTDIASIYPNEPLENLIAKDLVKVIERHPIEDANKG